MNKIIKFTLIYLVYLSIGFFKLNAKEETPYERFIGLGNCCVTRYQINYHLSKRFGKDSREFGGGQLFDWLVIHDYNKLAEAIENNLADLFERSDLILTSDWVTNCDYWTVQNMKYKMTWNHLFSRPGNGLVTDDLIDVEYDSRKHKIEYLAEKFKSLREYRTLYIIAHPCHGMGFFNTKKPNKSTLIRLRNALEKMRGNRNFSILFCSLNAKNKRFENIYMRAIVNPQNNLFWEGDYDCWNGMLSQFPFNPNKADTDKSGLDNSFSGS
jgi:hypothetical protein